MSVLKEKEPRNNPTAQLFFSWYSDVSTEMSLYAYVSYVSGSEKSERKMGETK